MDQFSAVFFLGLPLLLVFLSILDYFLDVFSSHPENLPASNQIKPEEELPLNLEESLLSAQNPVSSTRKEASTLNNDGFLPDENNTINNQDKIVSKLKASLAVSVRKEKHLENLHQEFVEKIETKSIQLEAAVAAFDEEISALMQVIQTLKSTVSSAEQERNLNPTPEANPKMEDRLLNKPELEAPTTDVLAIKITAEQKLLSDERVKQLECVAEAANRQLLEEKETSAKEIRELKVSIESCQEALKLAEAKRQEFEEILAKITQETEVLKAVKSDVLTEQRVKQLELVAEDAHRQLKELKETSSKEIAELKTSIESNQESLKLAEVLASEQEDKLLKALKEADTLRSEKALYEEQSKQLELVAGEANRQLQELKETSTKEIRELEASNETDKAALKISEDKVRILEDVLVKTTQEEETLKTEMSAALTEQKSLSEERTKQYEFVAEEAHRELQELRTTSAKETMKLRSSNETCQTALKMAEGKGRVLKDMLAKATQQAEALKTEMSDALAQQKSLFEDRVKQLEFDAKEAKSQLLELKGTTDRNITELKSSNESGQVALKVAEKKVQSMEEMLLERTQAAESLAIEQAAALTEAIDTLQLAVKHAKDEVSGVTCSVKEEPVGSTETLEDWLIKYGVLTRVPPKTWMQLLEHTGSLMEEKANNLKSKADVLFHNKPSDGAKTG